MTWGGKVELGELLTLIIGIAALLLGRYIRRSVPLFKRIDIPDAVIGATIVAVICLLAELLSGVRMSSRQILDLVLQRRSLHGAEAQICLPALHDKHFLLNAGPFTDKVDAYIGCILTLTEITDRKRTETQQTMLIAELNHRVKNILAIVQSVAWQTLSANQSASEFKRTFDGRLRTISLAHDILTQGRWGHVDFEQLVERSLAPYQGEERGPRAQWSGTRLSLPPTWSFR